MSNLPEGLKLAITIVGGIVTAILTFSLTRFSKKYIFELMNARHELYIKLLTIRKLEHELQEKGIPLPPRNERP